VIDLLGFFFSPIWFYVLAFEMIFLTFVQYHFVYFELQKQGIQACVIVLLMAMLWIC
jgi:hypothetical protein